MRLFGPHSSLQFPTCFLLHRDDGTTKKMNYGKRSPVCFCLCRALIYYNWFSAFEDMASYLAAAISDVLDVFGSISYVM